MANGKIPIAAVERLSEQYDAPIVVVFSLHDGGDSFNVTTFGASRALCRYAASLGKQIADKVLDGTIAPEPAEPTDLPHRPSIFSGRRR